MPYAKQDLSDESDLSWSIYEVLREAEMRQARKAQRDRRDGQG